MPRDNREGGSRGQYRERYVVGRPYYRRENRSPKNQIDPVQAIIWGGALGGAAGLMKDAFVDGTLVGNGRELGFMDLQSLLQGSEWIGIGVIAGAITGYGIARFLNSRR